MHAAPLTVPPAGRDSLGCSQQHLQDDAELAVEHLRLYRKRSGGHEIGRVETPASDRGFLVGVSLAAGHRRRILRPRHGTEHLFDPGAIYVRRFDDDYRADLHGAFDFLLVELAPGWFDAATDERLGARLRGLACVTAAPDPVLPRLAQALLPALQRPLHASRLLVEQLGLAIGTHLVEHYGGAGTPPRRRHGLSAAQEARAKELLRSRLDGDVSIGEVAAVCGLSRSHFTRAFRDSTGLSPHQWLTVQRMALACGLLQVQGQALADIAAACGFVDQSHFTRVFAKAMGRTPGAWRRLAS